MSAIEEYIRRAAALRGINPNVAVRAALSEGGLSDPYQRGRGPAPKSQKFGGTEHSFGPFQMYISGTGAGLGDAALAKGIDPRTNWKGGVDFALDTVAKEGWKQWYGPAKAGIGRWDGVKGAKPIGVSLTSSGPTDIGTITEPAGVEAAPKKGIQPDSALGLIQSGDVSGGILAGLGTLSAKPEGGGASQLDQLASAMGGGSGGSDIVPVQPTGALAAAEAADATRMASAQGLMAQILAARKSRVPGLSLMG